MKETPIIFSTDMVKAILNGSKSQTRRVMKPQPVEMIGAKLFNWERSKEGSLYREDFIKYCPYGQVGGLLWVRETYKIAKCSRTFVGVMGGDDREYYDISLNYKAYLSGGDGVSKGSFMKYAWKDHIEISVKDGKHYQKYVDEWRPSIHMPKWAARIWLEITGVRVERVQGISEQDAKAEGLIYHDGFSQWHTSTDTLVFGHKTAFQMLWDSLNAKRGYGWDTNPWCWMLSFKRVEK